MEIKIKRIYERPGPEDGIRILVDRLWPRGLSKESARVDYWARPIAPSGELRKWYGHDPDKWEEFRKRYSAELDERIDEVEILIKKVADGPATFLYSSTEKRFNNAYALKLYIAQWMERRKKSGKSSRRSETVRACPEDG